MGDFHVAYQNFQAHKDTLEELRQKFDFESLTAFIKSAYSNLIYFNLWMH